MWHVRHSSLGSIGLVVLTLSLLLSGCGAASTSRVERAAATSTPSPTPATAATATPSDSTTDPGPIATAPGCPPLGDAPTEPRRVTVGGLTFSVPRRPPMHDSPSELLPTGLPNAPYHLATSAVTTFAPNPPVNPSLGNGYELLVCNLTAEAHTLTSLSVTIATFAASSGPVAVWHVCEDGPYNSATKQTPTGCGGSLGALDRVSVTLPSDTAGASATAIGSGGAQQSASIGANQSTSLLIPINGLTAQGTYTLRFNVSVDGAAPTPLAPSDGAFLIAPAPAIWTGTACTSAAMQAQIPASTQDAYYVCPPGA